MRIAAPLGVHLSSLSSSMAPILRHVVINTANLEFEGSESSNFDWTDDSGSEGGYAQRDESTDTTAVIEESSSDDPNVIESNSD